MPEYYFRVPSGKYCNGAGDATELPDSAAARSEALKIWSDLTREIASELEARSEWRMQVADASGTVLMEIRTVLAVAP